MFAFSINKHNIYICYYFVYLRCITDIIFRPLIEEKNAYKLKIVNIVGIFESLFFIKSFYLIIKTFIN